MKNYRKYYRKKNQIYVYVLLILAIVLSGASVMRIGELKNNKEVVKCMENSNRDIKVEENSVTDMTINNVEIILMVNKENFLDENYEPKDIVTLDTDFISNGDPSVNKLKKEAAIALKELFDGAAKDNIYLLGVSGYRDYEYQKHLYEREVAVFGYQQANLYVAKPGESEHQTGLAIDILSGDYQSLDEGFENTEAYNWIEQNCAKYGFIIRYPKGKENITGYEYEPWHLRYVGCTVAEEIIKRNITLEEYVNQ